MNQVWRRGADHLFVPPAANSCACTSAPTGTAQNHALRQDPERHGAHYDGGNPTLLADDSQREMHAPDPAPPVPNQDLVTPVINFRGVGQEKSRGQGEESTHEAAMAEDPWSRASMHAAPPGLPGYIPRATPKAKSEAASTPARPTSVLRSVTGRTSAPSFDPWANYHPTIGPGGITEIDPYGRIQVGPVMPTIEFDHTSSSAAKATACPKASGINDGGFAYAPLLGQGAGSDPHDNPWWMHALHPDDPYPEHGGLEVIFRAAVLLNLHPAHH